MEFGSTAEYLLVDDFHSESSERFESPPTPRLAVRPSVLGIGSPFRDWRQFVVLDSGSERKWEIQLNI